MFSVLDRLVHDRTSLTLTVGIAVGYLVVFQYAIADISFDGSIRDLTFFALPNWTEVMLRQRVPFQFESVAIIEGPFVTWLLSPVNLAIGAVLGLLTGMQIGLTNVARKCSVSCGLNPAAGLLAGLPGLLAGSACCAPILFVILGLQLTAGLVTLMGLMVPIAFVLLVGGLAYTIRVAVRRCGEADELAAQFATG
ncbi:MAG: hypothetical protein GY798_21520 [Hyphomicrobiales bacterium]|nr:hypothetical protein [Hyphomicrobiales bacterium]